jgi:hypothetical protein
MEITLLGGRFVLADRAYTFVSLGWSETICSCRQRTDGTGIALESLLIGADAVMATQTETLAGWSC